MLGRLRRLWSRAAPRSSSLVKATGIHHGEHGSSRLQVLEAQTGEPKKKDGAEPVSVTRHVAHLAECGMESARSFAALTKAVDPITK
jgi:hypothetical protein